MFVALAMLAALQQVAAPPPASAVLRDPAFSPDGRLAVSIDGDLWVQRAAGRSAGWVRLTSGAAWDRHPAWSPDGATLVFVSDRGGNPDLWRVRLRGSEAAGAPERLTSHADDDLQPSVGRDGSIVFTRGRGAMGRVWVRAADGRERRLTDATLPERSAAISPDGRRVAYVQQGETGDRLRLRPLAGSTGDTVVVGDRSVQRVAWSRDGERLVLASPAPRPGTYVTPADGRYVNFVSSRTGAVAWSPDGATLAIAGDPAEPAGYNGDPDRMGDREVAEALAAEAELVFIDAPAPPGRGEVVASAPSPDRASRNAELFDRVWRRVDQVYFAAPAMAAQRAQWATLRDVHRPRALAARDDAALERVLHALTAARPPLRAEASGRAAVSSAHPVASAAGTEILARGGNVVDAAVATSFALGVVEPDASGIGGYGEMLIQLTGMARPALIEFMARAPEEASLANAALLQDGRYPSDGPVMAMVPGTVAGMHAAWKKYGSGKVPWKELLAPAIRAARDGYVVSDGLATTLRVERDGFAKYESSRALFWRDGRPVAAGDTIRNPDLAWTLERIAADGADGFYRGEVARRLVHDLRGKGNAVRLTDLSRYFAPERDPVHFTYRGHAIYSSAPPASGGAILAGQLTNLEQVPTLRPYTDDAATLHAMIAAWQLAPSSRGRIADPSLWPTDVAPFTSTDSARVRWRCFDPRRAVTPALFRGDSLRCADTTAAPAPTRDARPDADPPALAAAEVDDPQCMAGDHAAGVRCRAQGTTSFAVGDAEGNLVAVTQTLGTWGGNFYVTPGLGFLYNDKLTSYGTNPQSYGARLPFARHGSVLAPTIVFRGDGAARRPWFAVGAAGNGWINSAVYSGVVGITDLGLGPQQALELPRFLPRQRGTGDRRSFVIDVESGISPEVLRTLEAMGYRFNRISMLGELRMGYGAVVLVDGDRVRAGGDPRRGGGAAAVPNER